MHSEISEACEADRGNKFTAEEVNDLLSNPPSTLPDNEFMKFYEANVKGNFEEEMADLLIRNIQYCAYRKLDLDAHVAAKMRYNSLRPHKHGGKKY
jgi:NTP pyrophosphatase (non-canonical NTP hydrolase)